MPPNPTILPERRCSTRPRIARAQHAPGTQESGALWVRGARESRRHEPRRHGATLWTWGQGATTTQHPRRAGALAAPSQEAPSRPPTAPEAQGSRGRLCELRHHDPPATPGTRRIKPRKSRRMLCFSTNWAIKRINPHQRQQEESYVQDFQFHRQR